MLSPVCKVIASEGQFLLPGNDRRPADVYLPNWAAGQDSALDITVINLQQATVDEAAVTHGHSLNLAFESLGGWHSVAVTEVKKIAQAMARQTGRDESEVCSHAISRLSLLLMKGNSAILVNRIPSITHGPIDGVPDE